MVVFDGGTAVFTTAGLTGVSGGAGGTWRQACTLADESFERPVSVAVTVAVLLYVRHPLAGTATLRLYVNVLEAFRFAPPSRVAGVAPLKTSFTLTVSCTIVVGSPKANAWVTVPLCGVAGASPLAGSVHVTFAVLVPAAGDGACA